MSKHSRRVAVKRIKVNKSTSGKRSHHSAASDAAYNERRRLKRAAEKARSEGNILLANDLMERARGLYASGRGASAYGGDIEKKVSEVGAWREKVTHTTPEERAARARALRRNELFVKDWNSAYSGESQRTKSGNIKRNPLARDVGMGRLHVEPQFAKEAYAHRMELMAGAFREAFAPLWIDAYKYKRVNKSDWINAISMNIENGRYSGYELWNMFWNSDNPSIVALKERINARSEDYARQKKNPNFSPQQEIDDSWDDFYAKDVYATAQTAAAIIFNLYADDTDLNDIQDDFANVMFAPRRKTPRGWNW